MRKGTNRRKRTKVARRPRRKVQPDLRLKNYLIEPHPEL